MNRNRLYSLSPALFMLAAALTALLYGRALSLPFFFDDLDHIPYIAATNIFDMWRSSGGFPYYRPLAASLWRLFFVVGGVADPALFHFFNLLLHAINGGLVGLVASHFLKDSSPQWRRWTAVLATAFYVVYPFSYQAVPWVGAVYHLLVSTLTLIAVGATWQYLETGRSTWRWIAALAALLAPFAHENGVVLLLLLPVIAFVIRPDRRNFTWSNGVFWVAPTLIWLVVWSIVPKAPFSREFAFNVEAMAQNGVYFLQGLLYPTTIFTGRLVSGSGWPDFLTVFLFGVLASALILWGIVSASPHSGSRRLIISGLLWWLITSLPAIFWLDFAYILSSPRLLVLPSVGIALVWSGVTTALGHKLAVHRPTAWWPQIAVGGSVAYVLAASSWMVIDLMNHHTQLGQIWWQAAEITTQANRPGNDTVPVFVNFPSSLSGRQPYFPVGHEGTVFMVDYIPHQRIFDWMTGQPTMAHLRSFEDIRPQRDYIYQVLDSGRDWPAIRRDYPRIDVWLVEYLETELRLRQVGSSITPTRPTFPLVFEALNSELLTATAVQNGDQIVVEIVWRVVEPPPFEWVAFVHLIDENGALIGQADGPPWAGTYPLGLWSPTEQNIDRRVIPLQGAGRFVGEVQLGLYNTVSGARAAVTFPDGETGEVVPVPLEFSATPIQ